MHSTSHLRLLVVLVLLSVAASAQVCVDSRNTTSEDGTTLHPYRSVQAGVDAAAPGQSVRVATGTYEEDVLIENKAVMLLGGFIGGNSVQYGAGQAGDFGVANPAAYPTTIMGTGDDSVVTLFEAGASVIDGFRITGGGGSVIDLPYGSNGGGVFVRGGAPTIRNNTIDTNDARRPQDFEFRGGGIYSDDADIVIENNDIKDNHAGRGAGIAAFGGTVEIRDNAVHGNTGVADHGGGMYIGSPDATITGNRVYENEIGRDLGYGWGGGILVFNPGNSAELSHNEIFNNFAPSQGAGIFVDEGAEVVLKNELIYGNESEPGLTGGGAVYVDGGEIGGVQIGSTVDIINCTIAHNIADNTYVGGNGIMVEGDSEVTVRNSIIWQNGDGDEVHVFDTATIAVSFTDSTEALPGTGNISQDPRFADPAGGDFHVKSTTGRWDPAANGGAGDFVVDAVMSPCIDAGNPADDFSEEEMSNGGRINLGAYGNTPEASRSVAGGEGEPPVGCHASNQTPGRADSIIPLLVLAALFGMNIGRGAPARTR